MKTITLAQVTGYQPTAGMWPSFGWVDPYDKTVWVEFGDSGGVRTWDQIKAQFEVEIVLTQEEVEMVERGRAASKVEAAAKSLRHEIDRWLLKASAR